MMIKPIFIFFLDDKRKFSLTKIGVLIISSLFSLIILLEISTSIGGGG